MSLKPVTIKVNPKYANCIPEMSQKEFEQLKQSIKDDGLHYKLVVNHEYVLLDGHHRFRACKEEGRPITEEDIEIKTFADQLEELEFVLCINALRRQLTPFQRCEIIYELEKIETEKAAKRQKIGKKIPLSSNELEVGQARDIAIKKAGGGVSPTTYTRGKRIILEGTEEVKQKLRENRRKINAEFKAIKSKEIRQKLVDEAANSPAIELPEGTKLICGDFREVCKDIPDNSIDLIFTDPPYSPEWVHIYSDLGILANRVLKPGGSLVLYFGMFSLHEVMDRLTAAGFSYNPYWLMGIYHNGNHELIRVKGVYVGWKPLLWYVKGDKRPEGSAHIPDFIERSRPNKGLHSKGWDQSPIDADHVISKLTVENQIVLDPMMGSGTTGKAALNLKRKFIGIEIDQGEFNVARANISKSFSFHES